jgi:hypothetical protein
MKRNVATPFGARAEYKVILSSMTNLPRLLDSNPISEGIAPEIVFSSRPKLAAQEVKTNH